MKVLYQYPHESIYAGRTIYWGYKNAFTDMGHEFKTLTATSNLNQLLLDWQPNIFITSLNRYYIRYLDLDILKKAVKNGVVVFVNTPFWNPTISKLRINESPGLKNDKEMLELIHKGFGHIYFNSCETDDERMDGFEQTTGYKHYTIPLAADKTIIKPMYDKRFSADISYVGTYLPEKRHFFKEYVFPLKDKYKLKLYGQDWTIFQRILGWVQRGGQYFNIPYLRTINKPKLRLEDEAKIYNSSTISINVHEEYQKRYGGDCNERTFKIPLAGGFEITDDVACIRKYFKEGEEIVIAKDKKDWFEKIDYYIKNPEKRLAIIEAGHEKVLKKHTYHNRVEEVIHLYEGVKRS
ncbi:MAG: glycosyltransferase [candidate division WOR-3 bacterium]